MKGARSSPHKPPPDAQCHRGPVLASVAVVFVAVAIAAGTIDWDSAVGGQGQGQSTNTATQRDMTATSSTDGSDDVPVWDWTPDRSFAQQAVQFGRPVVIRNSVVTRWPAMTSWTPSYLTKNLNSESKGALVRDTLTLLTTYSPLFIVYISLVCSVQIHVCCCFCDRLLLCEREPTRFSFFCGRPTSPVHTRCNRKSQASNPEYPFASSDTDL